MKFEEKSINLHYADEMNFKALRTKIYIDLPKQFVNIHFRHPPMSSLIQAILNLIPVTFVFKQKNTVYIYLYIYWRNETNQHVYYMGL